MHKSKCKYCPATVLWVRSAATMKWLILDVKPNPAGNTIVCDDLGYVGPFNDMFDPAPPGETYMTHWATCPGAKQAREEADKKKR